MNEMDGPTRSRALSMALGAHALWGAMPVYLILVQAVPAVEYVAWRTFFTVPICLAFVALTGTMPELRRVLADRRAMLTLVATACLIAVNWLIYIWAVQHQQVMAASLGYYILPLVMTLMGVFLLKERLTRLQWLAVAVAAAGVASLSAGALTTMWMSLGLAFSFGLYGILRKTVAAGALAGLTVETIVLLPLVLAYLAWKQFAAGGVTLGRDGLESLGIVLGGPMTAVPLLLFAAAARALPYTLIGFLQFTAPTCMFLLSVFFFGEPLDPARLASFVAIWIAATLFLGNMLLNARRAPVPA